MGDGQEHGDDPAWDAAEAEALYDCSGARGDPGVLYARCATASRPRGSARMRESMARLTPLFSSRRAVREYTEQHYLPACGLVRERLADQGAKARQIVDWRRQLEQHWSALRFGELKVESMRAGSCFPDRACAGGLAPDSVAVELYADAAGDEAASRQPMIRAPAATSGGGYVYRCTVTGTRPTTDYTPRVIPRFDGVAVPLEAGRILWQR